MQKYIIDGYNFIHLISHYKRQLEVDLESARRQLIHDLTIYRASRQLQITLVFDGIPAAHYQEPERGIQIIFSADPQKADAIIKQLISKEKRKACVTVVTNDNEIINFAKQSGSHCLSCQDFYQRLNAKSEDYLIRNKFNHQMSAEELAEWKKIFGIDE